MLSGLGHTVGGRKEWAETFKKGAPNVWKSDRVISVIDLPTVKAYFMLGFLDFVVAVFSCLLNIISVGVRNSKS